MRFQPYVIDQIRARLPISQVVGRRVTFDKRKSQPARGDFWACCPFHKEKTPSFHCDDRRGIYKCFGCGATGDHFAFLTELEGYSFPDAVKALAEEAGVDMPANDRKPVTSEEIAARRKREQEREEAYRQSQEERAREEAEDRDKSVQFVKRLWAECRPLAGTVAEAYLTGRRIDLDDVGGAWPKSLRYHPGLWMPVSDEYAHGGRSYPALVGGVQNVDRELVALWRVFLDDNGKALTDYRGHKIKKGLGPSRGGAVRFGPADTRILVAEGMETALGVMGLVRGRFSVWSTTSTSGMKTLEWPPCVKRIDIYADGDSHRYDDRKDAVVDGPGKQAATTLAERARAAGVEAAIFPAPEPDDWLDVFQSVKRDLNHWQYVENL